MLVNNAGFIAMGPLSEIPLDRLRLQFETNVISNIAMIQAFVPAMIRNRSGMIVSIGSVSGILPTPFAGSYCATKSAIHTLSDVLRVELAPFGIRTITVQPGGIASELGNTAHKGIIPSENGTSNYATIADAIVERATASQKNATPVDVFASQLVTELTKRNPKPVIRLGKQSFLLPLIRYALTTGARDRLLIRKFKLHRLLNKW
jgi:short-subunit dehydrogenase